MPDSPPTADLLRATLRDFRRTWAALAAYELALKLLGGLVLLPAAAWLLAKLIATTGRTAVSNTDLFGFVLTPTGLATAAFLGLATLGATLLEHTGVLAVAALKLSGQRVTVRHGAVAVLVGVVRVLRL